MKKGLKILGTLLLLLGLSSIGAYFIIGDSFNDCKITFDSNGGTAVAEQIIKKGDKVVKPTDPTKDNNDFIEWQLNGVAYDFNNSVSNSLTLKALWKEFVEVDVVVTLDDKEYSTNVREGETLDVDTLNIPSKDGFIIKFYTNENSEYDLNNPVTSSLALTAKYIEVKNYTVKFNSNGGSSVDNAIVMEGNTISEPVVTRNGYNLEGWYLGEEKFDFTTPITKNITLKAKWIDPTQVTVTFMVDSKVYKTSSVKENTTVSKPTNPTKKGYKFIDWQLDGNSFDFKTKITENITLNASFEEVSSYTVTFDSNGGSSVKAQEVTSKVTKPADPTRDGYKFVEWQLNNKKFDFNTAITEDITLKAVWEKDKEKYIVTFNDDDNKEITTQTVEEGDKAVKPSDPIKDGYRFVGWLYNHAQFNFDTPITQNITLTAYYEKTSADAVDDLVTNIQ